MNSPYTLIYLEDDEALASVTIRALEKRNFNVIHFSSLEQFSCWQAENTLKDISHALLDLRLDDGNTLSIIQDLLKANPSLKIVILTGYSSISTTVQAIKLGATNYLAKPATIEQILNAFEEIGFDENELEQDEQKLSLKRLEWEHIQQALADNQGNISATARQLNMHRRTLQRKLNKKPSD